MGAPSYTTCVEPQDYQDPAFPTDLGSGINWLLFQSGGLDALLQFCDYELGGKLVCLGGERCAIGIVASFETVDDKDGLDQIDNDFCINLALCPDPLALLLENDTIDNYYTAIATNIEVSGLSGAFVGGTTTITGSTSGATATVAVLATPHLALVNVQGSFQVGESIVGGSPTGSATIATVGPGPSAGSLDVTLTAPNGDGFFANGAVTGAVSGATATISGVISATELLLDYVHGQFQVGEVLQGVGPAGAATIDAITPPSPQADLIQVQPNMPRPREYDVSNLPQDVYAAYYTQIVGFTAPQSLADAMQWHPKGSAGTQAGNLDQIIVTASQDATDYVDEQVTAFNVGTSNYYELNNFIGSNSWYVPVLHCEIEGDRVCTVCTYVKNVLGGPLADVMHAFCNSLGWFTRALCAIISLPLAPLILPAVALAATQGWNDGSNDNRTFDAASSLKIGDLVLVRGRWVYDAGHAGNNEIHAVHSVMKLGDTAICNEPARFADAYTRWCNALSDVPRTVGPRGGKDDSRSKKDQAHLDAQLNPANRWFFHPSVDGCRDDRRQAAPSELNAELS